MDSKLLGLFATLLIPTMLPFLIKRFGIKVPARKWVVWYVFWIFLASLIAFQIFTIEHILSVKPTDLDFGETLNELSMVVTNNGTGVIRWEVQGVTEEWLTLSQVKGEVGANKETVKVTINRTMIPPGDVTTRFFIVGREGENATVWVRVLQR